MFIHIFLPKYLYYWFLQWWLSASANYLLKKIYSRLDVQGLFPYTVSSYLANLIARYFVLWRSSRLVWTMKSMVSYQNADRRKQRWLDPLDGDLKDSRLHPDHTRSTEQICATDQDELASLLNGKEEEKDSQTSQAWSYEFSPLIRTSSH